MPLLSSRGSGSAYGFGLSGLLLPPQVAGGLIVTDQLNSYWNSTNFTSGSLTWDTIYAAPVAGGKKTLTFKAAGGRVKTGNDIALTDFDASQRVANAPFIYSEIPTGNAVTIELYTNVVYGAMKFGFTSYDVYMSSGIGINTGASDTYGIADSSANFNVLRHWVWVFPSTGDIPTGMRLYINGVQQATSQRVAVTGSASSSNFQTGFTLNSWNNDTSYPGSQTIRSLKLYTKALSQAEVTKNYNYAVATGIG
jgi:hypothetical protein